MFVHVERVDSVDVGSSFVLVVRLRGGKGLGATNVSAIRDVWLRGR